MNALKILSVCVLCLYIAFLASLFLLQRAMIYPGTKTRVSKNPPSAPGSEVIHLQTPVGRIEAIFLPASVPEKQPVMIFGHGNGEVIDFWTSSFEGIRGPVLVIHGKQDRLIPWRVGKLLAEAAKDGTFRLYDCGHGCWDPEHLPFWQDAEPILRRAGILVQKGAGS